MNLRVQERAVLQLIRSGRATSQIQLARSLGVRPNTIHCTVKRLEELGLIVLDRTENNGHSRPLKHYRMQREGTLLAIQCFGSILSGAVFVGESLRGTIQNIQSAPVKNLADACRSLREMRDLVLAKSGVSRADLDGVVLNINAIRLKPNRVISSSVIPWIREASEKDFTRALNCPVKMHIQTPWVLPELRLRQADGVNSLIVLSIGDGVSAHGVSVDSQWMSERYYRGELGHVVLDPKGPVCGCGHRGCVEALISGPALLQRVETDLRNGIQTELADRPAKSPVDLFVRLEQLHAGGKDSYVRTLVEEFLDRVAWCVSLIANLVGPDLIALRGYALEGRESWLQRILQRTGPMVLGEVSNLRLAFARASTEDCLRELVRLPSEKTISL